MLQISKSVLFASASVFIAAIIYSMVGLVHSLISNLIVFSDLNFENLFELIGMKAAVAAFYTTIYLLIYGIPAYLILKYYKAASLLGFVMVALLLWLVVSSVIWQSQISSEFLFYSVVTAIVFWHWNKPQSEES